MKITILNGGHRSIELPLSDEELNFQMRQMGIRETIPKGKLVKVSEKHCLTRAHREKQLKMSCQALHNAPPNRT